MKRDRRHITALILTVLLHGAVLALMLVIFMRYDPASEQQREWPPVDSAEILFGGEYVMAGDIPEPGHDDLPAQETSQAEPAASDPQPDPAPSPDPTLTTKQPSEAKAPDKPKTDSKADAERREAEMRAKREEEQRRAEEKRRKDEAGRINSRVNFGNSSGKSGQADGQSATGAVSGVSASGLGNRQALSLPQPPRGPMGKVVITIKVDRQGNVTSATFLSGSGGAGASAEARRQCIAAARKARFSAAPDGPASQTGTLTYVYK